MQSKGRDKWGSHASGAAKWTAQTAGAVGAQAAGRARDYGAKALDQTKRGTASAQRWTQQQDWAETRRQTVDGVARAGKTVARGTTAAAVSSAAAVRAHSAQLTQTSRYDPDRVTPDTKVRGAPGVWLSWLTLGWAGVHRLAAQDSEAKARAHFLRRLAVFVVALIAVVVGGNLLVARLGVAPQEMLREFGLDFAAGNVTGVGDAVDEAKQNAIDYAVATGAILALIVLAVIAMLAYWAKDFFWVLKHTKARKRENAQRKEEALRQRAAITAAPGTDISDRDIT